MKVPDLWVGKQLFVGLGLPKILGGADKTAVRGSGYVEGPMLLGDPSKFAPPAEEEDEDQDLKAAYEAGPTEAEPEDETLQYEIGTVMCAETINEEMTPVPWYSLFVRTYARIKEFLKVDTLLTVKLIKSKIIYADVIMAKTKNFVIDHPQREGKKLVYACLEGPENSVYVRGRVKHTNEIGLPEVWKDLIDPESITVSITPIGSHQDVIVKGISQNKVVLQSKAGFPIDCYYHVFAERNDIEKLVTEPDNDA